MRRIIEIQDVTQGYVRSRILSTGETLDFVGKGFLDSLHKMGLVAPDLKDTIGLVLTLDIPSMTPIRFIANTRQHWLVDEHEPDQYLKILGATEKVTLHAGDYATKTVRGFTLGVERKSSEDLYASAWPSRGKESSRLATEMPKFITTYDIPVLLVCYEGLKCTYDGLLDIPSMGPRLRIRPRPWSALQKVLLGYQREYPSLLVWVSSREVRVPYDIIQIKKYFDEVTHLSQLVRPTIAQGVPVGVAMLTAIEGVDVVTATKVMEHYQPNQSIEAILQGGKEKLLEISGVGQVTASAIISALKGITSA